MAQYQAFLGAVEAGSAASVPASCDGFGGAFAPANFQNGCSGSTFDPVGHPHDPVACVNWCQASAFCAWSGKRLCGVVGGGKLPSTEDSGGLPWSNSYDEWYGACSNNGGEQFPWGALDFDAGRGCNTPCRHGSGSDPVGSLPGCVGPEMIYDQAGNVSEWVNECDGTALSSYCLHEGDSFSETVPPYCGQCDSAFMHPRVYAASDVGIRCCGDAR